jgi:hypothetical protein
MVLVSMVLEAMVLEAMVLENSPEKGKLRSLLGAGPAGCWACWVHTRT